MSEGKIWADWQTPTEIYPLHFIVQMFPVHLQLCPEFMSCSISTVSHQLVSEFSCLPGLQSILEQDQKISV